MRNGGRRRALTDLNNCESHLELLFRFFRWADLQRGPLTRCAVQEAFHVSRAQAYRWIAAWNAANGIPPAGAKQQGITCNTSLETST
jgi:hypothetical protein